MKRERHHERTADSSILAVLLAVLVIFAASSLGAQPAPSFLESIDVNVVNVEVYATDKKGNPLTDLTAQDFQIFEDGKKMKLTHFAQMGSPEAPAADEPTATPPGRPPGPEGAARIVFLVDNLTIQRQNRRLILAKVRSFVEERLAAGSLVMIAAFEGHLRVLQPFTTDRALLLSAIADLEQLSPLGLAREAQRRAILLEGLTTLQEIRRAVRSDARGTEAARYLSNASRQVDIHAERLRSEARETIHALSLFVNALAALPGRKALVYISDGIPMRPGDELYFAIQQAAGQLQPGLIEAGGGLEARQADINNRSAALGALSQGIGGSRRAARQGATQTRDLEMLTALASSSQVSFYPIKALDHLGGVPAELEGDASALYTPQMRSVRATNLSDTLRVMADRTGGVAAIGGDILALLEGAQADHSQHYSLGYSPPHAGDGKRHEIKVKVRRKGVRLRYRVGYVDKPLAAKLADRTAAALLLGLDENPLGVSFEVGDFRPSGVAGQWIVTLTVRIPLDRVTLVRDGDVRASDLQLYIGADDPEGRTAPVQSGVLRIEVPEARIDEVRGRIYNTQLQLVLREGRQRLALGLVDPGSGSASFVSRELVIGRNAAEAPSPPRWKR